MADSRDAPGATVLSSVDAVTHHDLVIIGSGSGNSILDSRFDDLDVALVEHGVFGGTCLNVGCIPTKMYVYAADVAEAVRESGRYGIDASIDKVRWSDIRDRVFGRIDPISAGGRRYRDTECSNVTLYQGHAAFTGERELAVAPTDGSPATTVTGDRIVIAAGSRPTVPAVITDAGVPYHTSDDVMRLEDLPRRMIILGGGYIAAEFAHVFDALGVEVTVVTRGPALLREQDELVSARFTAIAAERFTVRTDAAPTAAEQRADGTIALTCPSGETIEGDALLVATGRRPNGDRMDVARTGLQLTRDGRIEVDEYQRTSVEGIWALGDVSSPYQLKHVANHEARVVQHNLLHPDALRTTSHRFVPSAVFTHPQVASVGRREQDLRDSATPFVAKVQAYGDVAFGWAMEDTTGFVKVLAAPDGTLLGAHFLGPQASSLIQVLVQAMEFGQKAQEVAHGQYWIHPALPELIENALLGLPLGS